VYESDAILTVTVRSCGVGRDLVDEIDAALRAAGSPERAVHERAYLKSQLEHYGVSVPRIRSVARQSLADHPGLGHDELLDLVVALWDEPVHERRMIVVELLEENVDLLEPGDIELLERMLRASRTWALVDGLAASVVGPLVERYGQLGAVLDRWATDDDFWLRRSALLALLVPLRRGEGDFDRFGRYADAMPDDHEFFIRKAIGWVLRDTARKRPDMVVAWLMPRVSRASSVTLREAVKPLSDQQRTALTSSRRSPPPARAAGTPPSGW
jgi:3-methyladenine DNA glycosylase AlkD